MNKRLREEGGLENSRNSFSQAVLLKGPVFRPYQHGEVDDLTNVRLDFNFWMNNGCIIPSDLSDCIEYLLNKDSSSTSSSSLTPPPFLQRQSVDSMQSVYVYAVHGLDPDYLHEALHTLPFLKSCSSMPLRFTADRFSTSTFNDLTASRKPWRYSLVDSLTSNVMWPERKPQSISSFASMSLVNLFKENRVLVQGIHSQWSDQLLFASDETCLSSYTSIVQNHDKPSLIPSDNSFSVGRFQRQARDDAGSNHLFVTSLTSVN